MQERSASESLEKLAKLIGDVKVAMLTTVDDDGSLRSRPMMTQKAEFDGRLWFFTKSDSSKSSEIQREHRVNVSYSDPSSQVYVSVSGTARLLNDPDKIRELWTPAHRAWFPDGLEDPDLSLLRVDADKAEYWDAPSSMIVQAIGFTKAMLTGKAYGDEAADHGKVTLTK